MVDRSTRLVSIKVGWGEPTEDGEFIFNFHIRMGLVAWKEMSDYKSLSALNVAFKASSDTYRNINFPHFGKKETAFIFDAFREMKYDKEKIKAVERHRVLMEIWINCITNNIFEVSSETRRMCRIILFNSYENAERFNGWMRANGVFEGDSGLDSIEEGDEDTDRKSQQVLFSLGPQRNDQDILFLNKKNLSKTLKKKDYLRKNVAGSDTVISDNRSDTSKSIFGNLFKNNSKSKTKSTMSDELASTREGSAPRGPDEAIAALSAMNKTAVLLTTQVQRGEEAHTGVQIYHIYLRVTGKSTTPVVYRTYQRYNNFKQLCQTLLEMNEEASGNSSPRKPAEAEPRITPYNNFMSMILAPFPSSPVKSYLGISLNGKELAARTRMLDAWFREVCFYYRDMPAPAREAVRKFLNFDMKQTKDVFVHDQLAWGIMEAPKVDSPLLIVRRSTLINLHDSVLDETNAAQDSNAAKNIRYYLKDSSSGNGASSRGGNGGNSGMHSAYGNSSGRTGGKAKSVN